MKTKILNGRPLPNMPWQERGKNSGVFWRHDRNPIVRRDALAESNSIMNSAIVPFRGGFAGVFRVDDRTRKPVLHAGFSDNGIDWRIEEAEIRLRGGLPFEYGYDPRVSEIDGRYYVSWCNGYRDYPTIGLAVTDDFQTFDQFENAFLPYNRNGVLFPRRFDGMFKMLSRPSDPGHTPFGDIFISDSPDLHFWGNHRLVMRSGRGWEATKIGAGPVPIETDCGWLLLYHGVLTSCSGLTYSMGGALLDRDEPSKVLARCSKYLFHPTEFYECVGDTPNVIFPCSALVDADTGRLAVYYGCADTCIGVAYAHIDEVVNYILENNSIRN